MAGTIKLRYYALSLFSFFPVPGVYAANASAINFHLLPPVQVAYTPLPQYSISSLPDYTPLPSALPDIVPSPPPPPWQSAHEEAVRLARRGEYRPALAILKKIHKNHPEDASVARDYLAVLGWAGHDADVIKLYRALPKGHQPDYVLEAVGHAYLDLKQYNRALAVFRQGMKQSPRNAAFATGIIRSLNGLGRSAEAVTWADMDLRLHGDRLEVLLAAADAAVQDKEPYKALYYDESAHQLSFQNYEALRGLISLTDEIGAPQLAIKLANEHPGVIDAAEYRHIEGDEAAALVRWGVLEPSSEATRFAATDEAIARLDALIAGWSPLPEARRDALRARFDRLVALRNRSRMRDVIAEYDRLRRENVAVPAYALSSVADAYLYLRQPERARDLYLEALKSQPGDFYVRRQLFYAYVECDDFKDAYRDIDALEKSQPIWRYMKGLEESVPNPLRMEAEVDAGYARMYAGELAEADRRITAVANAAPNDAGNRAALGAVYDARGWPRRAQEQYEIGSVLAEGRDASNETGIAATELELQHFQTADVKIQNLINRFPENSEVQRADRLWQVHNMAELDVTAGFVSHPSASVQGGEGFGVETKMYSSPVDDNWRVFADELFSHEAEPFSEGAINLSRTAAGIEYRNGGLTADAAPTENLYHDSNRIGGWGEAAWTIDDRWSIGGRGEIFSRDTPLRAINAGVTANSISANANWRQNESRSVSITGEAMHFSDGNMRTGVTGDFTQRLYTLPEFYIDGLLNLGESQNSRNENRSYYNPSRDFLAQIGARAVQTIFQRYETVYEHSLQIMPGTYWEQDFGASDAVLVRYEQRLRYNDVLDVSMDLDYAHQSYDGVPENDVGVTINLVDRF